MNPSPSPIASPIPARSTVTPFQAALAAQIGVLTHLTDRMERFRSAERGNPASAYVEGETAVIHSVIDALNALYEAAQSPAETLC